MSTDASTSAPERAAPVDYDRMLSMLDTAIAEAERKIENGRIRDAKKDQARVAYIRALVYAVDVRRKVTSERSKEELAERIERLEEEGVPLE